MLILSKSKSATIINYPREGLLSLVSPQVKHKLDNRTIDQTLTNFDKLKPNKVIAINCISPEDLPNIANYSIAFSRLKDNGQWILIKGDGKTDISPEDIIAPRSIQVLTDLRFHSHTLKGKPSGHLLPSERDLEENTFVDHHDLVISPYGICKYRAYDYPGDILRCRIFTPSNISSMEIPYIPLYQSHINKYLNKDNPFSLRVFNDKITIDYLPWGIFILLSKTHNNNLDRTISEKWSSLITDIPMDNIQENE